MTAHFNGTGPAKQTLGDRALESWNRFWFTPADPAVLGLVRVFCGLITLYTALAYSLDLQEFFGPDAWWNLDSANAIRRERPYVPPGPLRGREISPTPADDFQKLYAENYKSRWGD